MNQLVGVWHLRTYRVTGAEGRVVEPFGPEPVGTGIYTEDGTVSAVLMRPSRTSWGSGVPAGDADPDLVVAAAAGFIAYSGSYEIDLPLSTVRHHVTCSLAPDWVGTVLERSFSFEGDELVLRTAPRASRTAELRWAPRAR